MGIMANYTIEELEEQVEEKSAEELLSWYLEEIEKPEELNVCINVARDLSNKDSYSAFETLDDFVEFLLFEDVGVAEEFHECKFDLALDAIEAYTVKNSVDFTIIDGPELDIIYKFVTAVEDTVTNGIYLYNETEEFKKHFNI